MKKFLAVLFVTGTFNILYAQQNVGIGTTTPNASAQLDVVSTTKGFLMPRMTSAQRIAIASPANGLMVYETTTGSIWVYAGSSWLQLASGGVSPWAVSGNNIYNTNTGNVGIGTTTPAFKFHVAGAALFENGTLDISDNIPTLRLKDGSTLLGYVKVQGTGDVKIGTYVTSNPTGRVMFDIEGLPKMTIEHSGDVGIGTISPGYKLDVRGDIYAQGNLRLEDGYIRIDNTTNTTNWQVSNSSALGGRLLFLQQGIERVLFRNDGNVGIGGVLPLTNNGFPDSKLHIESGQDAGLTSGNNGYLMLGPSSGTNIAIDNNEILARNGYTGTSTLFLQNNGGQLSIRAPTTINTDAEALKINGTNSYMAYYDANVFKALIGFINGNLRFDAGSGNATIVAQNIRMTPNVNGQVSIGVSVAAASGYKLTVDGKIICEEVRVKLRANWPDYVFADDYRLRSLNEVEQFIQVNKHLPGMVPATEIEKQGLDVGDMNKRLLEKVEELTLYIIQQHKEIEQLKIQMQERKGSN